MSFGKNRSHLYDAISRQEKNHPVYDFAHSEVFSILFKEGMSLVEETATYLDNEGRSEARRLTREGALTYTEASTRMTTRLMQAASWLVMNSAILDGDMSLQEAMQDKYRLAPDSQMPEDIALLGDIGLRAFIDRADKLYGRIQRLDGALFGEKEETPRNAVHDQFEKLAKAATQGGLNPQSIWKEL